jgi:asparagine synthetase B (glutamine-hydrolysing)
MYHQNNSQIGFYRKYQITLNRNNMFFFAITKNEISQNFETYNTEQFKIKSYFITIVTDNFLSRLIMKQKGLSIIESPNFSDIESFNIVFSEVNYNDNETVKISKSTISGRPIFYHINQQGEFFCSTHISMFRTAGIKIEENIEVLPEFFVYRIVMPPHTLYKNIYRLPMGGEMTIDTSNGKCKIKSIEHYNLPEKNNNITSIKECAKKLIEYYNLSFDKLNTCNNEIALLLSGGIDSSIMSKLCKEKFGIDQSYSTSYSFEDAKRNTEKKYAFSAAKALGMNHKYYEPSVNDYLFGFIEAISFSEEPLHHLQSVLLHLLFKNGIPDNKKILVVSQGAGVTFGYFPKFPYMKDKPITKILLKKPIKKMVNMTFQSSEKGRNIIETLDKSNSKVQLNNPDNPIWSWADYGSKKWACEYFNVTEKDIINKQYESIKHMDGKSIYDIWTFYSLLDDEDITTSIWTKIGEGTKRILFFPYYDVDTQNYVLSIPWKLKLKSRNILRKEIARYCEIPKFIYSRPKSGFGIHPKRWSEKGGIFEPLIPLASKVFDEKEIRKMQSTEFKKAMTYWNMLNYSIWKRLCINNEPLEVLKGELKEII